MYVKMSNANYVDKCVCDREKAWCEEVCCNHIPQTIDSLYIMHVKGSLTSYTRNTGTALNNNSYANIDLSTNTTWQCDTRF